MFEGFGLTDEGLCSYVMDLRYGSWDLGLGHLILGTWDDGLGILDTKFGFGTCALGLRILDSGCGIWG